ncbi:carboxypeptidase-like regulatory domain-containing protein [Polaribacter marinivivus]|uniref:Carboxypeptidase-like regulatory domain-containing protein n=1 Tax=Polaribacter marinivivus TaxID=1524260 RepID=A0ABV8R6M3_9FLAO
MKIKTLILFLIGLSFNLTSQNQFSISGVIFDKKTKNPLPFASVVYVKKSLGTTSDINGNFSFTIFNAKKTDTILISHIGYKTLKLQVSEINKIKNIALLENTISLKEIIIKTKSNLKLKKFIKETILNYNNNKKQEPHIAIAHYREKAKKNSKYIMFMESVGYSVYAGKTNNASQLSNYKFFNKLSRAYVNHPKWKAYKKNEKNLTKETINPSGGSNLNAFRYTEIYGVLSKKNINRYKFKVDSTFFIKDDLVYVFNYKGNIDNGILYVIAKNKHIIKITSNTKKYYSQAFQKRIPAELEISFSYYINIPFISKIDAYIKHKDLTYTNTLTIKTQKFKDFKFSNKDYWSLNRYETNPYIFYDSIKWNQLGIKEDKDYYKIAIDLVESTSNLENHFKKFNNRWFFNTKKNNYNSIKIIEELKLNF